jgi:sec-independent protein translocase protein TatA
MGSFGSGELIIVLIIVLLVFGGSQLPKLAKNLGKAQKEFKDGLAEGMKDDKQAAQPVQQAQAPQAVAPPPPPANMPPPPPPAS